MKEKLLRLSVYIAIRNPIVIILPPQIQCVSRIFTASNVTLITFFFV